MRPAYAISLIVIVFLSGLLAVRQPDTASELLPMASAARWAAGEGRALTPELIGSGIRPAHVVRIGTAYVPRTPPVMMLQYGGVCRIYSEIVKRPLDGRDLGKLSWWINFLGVFPWALLLFAALQRLARFWGCREGTKPIWAAWAAIAGSLALGWFGAASPYLPVAALACWIVALVLESIQSPSIHRIVLAGILSGLAGAWHPSGWLWVVFGIFLLFVSPPKGSTAANQNAFVMFFSIASALAIMVTLSGNFLFFGTLLPVQMIDLQPIVMDLGGILRLLWHDVIGWNGVIWLAPLILIGLLWPVGKQDEIPARSVTLFLLGLLTLTLMIWGVADDARLIGELDRIRPEFLVTPVELTDGEFQTVHLGGETGTEEERRAYYERLIERTDVFMWSGGRSPGIPVLLPVACLLGLLGWCNAAGSGFRRAWKWLGVRLGGLFGLIMSQAPYGAVADYYVYIGFIAGPDYIPVHGHVPILESILAVSIKLAELWPSGVVRF